MTFLRGRFPPARDLWLLLLSCAFPVHTWAILVLLRDMPALVLRANLWELIGVIAYTQALALLESIAIVVFLTFWAVVLPARIFRNRFVSQGTVLVWVSAAWVVGGHFDLIRPFGQPLLFLVLYSVSVAAACALVYRSRRADRIVAATVDRLTVLSFVYVFLGSLGRQR